MVRTERLIKTSANTVSVNAGSPYSIPHGASCASLVPIAIGSVFVFKSRIG